MAFHPWVKQASKEQMAAGLAADQAEQKAEDSYQQLAAPPCPACGVPVADKDWERHKIEAHVGNEMCQPYGKPDSREALFLAHDHDEMEKKIAIWKSKHPGVQLAFLGEGTRYEGKLAWARYRVLDSRGKAKT